MNALGPIAAVALADYLEVVGDGSPGSTGAPAILAAEGAGFYEDLRDGFAKEIIAQYATSPVVLVKRDALATGDPLAPFADTSAIRYPRNAIVLGYPAERVDDKRIFASDRRVLFDASGLTSVMWPAGGDTLEIDGRDTVIENVKAVPADSIPVIFIVQARTAGIRPR